MPFFSQLLLSWCHLISIYHIMLAFFWFTIMVLQILQFELWFVTFLFWRFSWVLDLVYWTCFILWLTCQLNRTPLLTSIRVLRESDLEWRSWDQREDGDDTGLEGCCSQWQYPAPQWLGKISLYARVMKVLVIWLLQYAKLSWHEVQNWNKFSWFLLSWSDLLHDCSIYSQ